MLHQQSNTFQRPSRSNSRNQRATYFHPHIRHSDVPIDDFSPTFQPFDYAYLDPQLLGRSDLSGNIVSGPRITEIERNSSHDSMDRRFRSHRPSRNALPFGRAMKKLFEQVTTAEQSFSNFQSDYDNEVTPLKKYADDKTLNILWKRRVAGKRDPKTVMEGEDKDNNEALRESQGKFEDIEGDPLAALTDAVESSFTFEINSSSLKEARYDDAERVKDKIRPARNHIQQLLLRATEGRHQCSSLLTELTSLKNIIDPIPEQNQILYRTPEDHSGFASDSMAGNNSQDDEYR